MTAKEEELIKALLNLEDKEAPEAAYIFTKGMDQDLSTNAGILRLLTHLLKSYKGQRNSNTNRIALNHFFPHLIKEAIETYVINLEQAMIMLALYHFYPQKDDNYDNFNFEGLLGAFDPRDAEKRMQDAIPLFVEGIASRSWHFKYYPSELRGNKKIVLEILKEDGAQFKYVSEDLKSDHQVILEAIKDWYFIIKEVSEETRSNKVFMLKAINIEGFTFEYSSKKLRSDKTFVLESMKKAGTQLRYVSEELKSDKEVVLMAVSNDAEAFAYASEDLRSDKKFQEEVHRVVIDSVFKSIKKELQDDNVTIDLSPILSFSVDKDTQLFEQAWSIVVNAILNDTSVLEHYFDNKKFNIKTLLLSIYLIVWLGGNTTICNRMISIQGKKWSNLFDGLRTLLDVLKLKCEDGNENWYEVLLKELSFNKGSRSHFTEISLCGIEKIGYKSNSCNSSKDLVRHSYGNKAFKIFIFKLIQDRPKNSKIHESLTTDNLFQWTLNALDECTGVDIQSDDSSNDMEYILERDIPEEFYTNWEFINKLFLFEYEHDYEPFIFRLAYEYVLNQMPKNGFNAKNIKNNFQLFSKFILENPPFFEFVPNTITKDNKSALIELLNKDEELFDFISHELSSDKEFALEFVKSMPIDSFIFERFVESSKELFSNKDFALEAVKLNYEVFCDLSDELQLDKEIVLETCKSAEKTEANIVEFILESQSWIGQSVSAGLFSDIDFAMDLLKISPWAGDDPTLMYLSDSLRSNKKVVLEAIKNNGYALDFASEALQNDPELIALAEKSK